MEHPMQKLNDLSRSLAPLQPDGTLIAIIEMSQSSWLVAGIVPGVERQPLKKLAADEIALLKLLHRWREEAEKAGRRIERTAVANGAPSDHLHAAVYRLSAIQLSVASHFRVAREQGGGFDACRHIGSSRAASARSERGSRSQPRWRDNRRCRSATLAARRLVDCGRTKPAPS